MSLESLLEHGEHIIWQDRPSGPGTRRFGERPRKTIGTWGPFVLLMAAAAGLAVSAILGEEEGRVRVLLTSLLFMTFPLMILGPERQERRFLKQSEFHYALTEKRLIVMNMTDGETIQIFAGGLAKLVRWGDDLHVRGRAKDDWVTMFDLKDAQNAQRVIARTLGPIR